MSFATLNASVKAMGRVKTHDRNTSIIFLVCPFPVAAPIPNNAPTETCVVDTANPNLDAKITRNAVTRFPVKPCSAFISVIFWLMTTAIRRTKITPPKVITTAMAA